MRILLAIIATLAFLGSASAQLPTTTAPNISNIAGNFPISKFNSGTGASAGTYWRGDGTWASPSAGTGAPGGSNTQVQYNCLSLFCGITGATTDGTTLTLVAPVLGTPASVTLTNATGTAASLTAGSATTTNKINGVDQTTAWTTYTPTLSCTSGTLTSASATGASKQSGKTVFLRVAITVITLGTCATGINISLPVNPLATTEMSIQGKNIVVGQNVTGRIRSDATPNNSITSLTRYDGTLGISNGDVISITGVYEAN